MFLHSSAIWYDLFELTKGKMTVYVSLGDYNVLYASGGGMIASFGSLDELEDEIRRYFAGVYDSFL